MRVDFIVTPEGRPYLIEINTIPGMSAGSIVPKQVRAAGMTLGELYDLIIADEITASLDPDTSGQIMENLLALPCMVVAITHDVSGAFMKQFDKVYRVEHGSVTQA